MSYGTMIDVTGEYFNGLLSALGSNWPDTIAVYVTGSSDIEETAAQIAQLDGNTGVFRYDQTPALAAFAAGNADCADIETGAATIDSAVTATKPRESHNWWSWWYVNDSDLAAARTAVSAAGLKKVQFGVANWNLSQAEAEAFVTANSDVAFVQWASPSTNPDTVCPGTSRTLSALNVDLNVTLPGWFVKQVPVTAAPKYKGLVVASDLSTYSVTSNDLKTWSV